MGNVESKSGGERLDIANEKFKLFITASELARQDSSEEHNPSWLYFNSEFIEF